MSRDIRAAILSGRMVALTAFIGSGKTILSRRLRTELEREGRLIPNCERDPDRSQHTGKSSPRQSQ